jgi:hypothetical protein
MVQAEGDTVRVWREWAMPNSETFDIETIGLFVRRHLEQSKLSVDPFARNKRWATLTNDLSPDTEAEFHMEALEFLEMLHNKNVHPDLAIFDPPYSLRQCAEVYQSVGRKVTMQDTQIFGHWTDHKDMLSRILTPDAAVLSFGWNSQGMGLKHGFQIEEVMLVCHGGAHHDTICMAERRIQTRLF